MEERLTRVATANALRVRYQTCFGYSYHAQCRVSKLDALQVGYAHLFAAVLDKMKVSALRGSGGGG